MKHFILIVTTLLIGVLISCEKEELVSSQEEGTKKVETSNLKSLQSINLNESNIISYANTWGGLPTNPFYPRHIQDCANFASQCLEAGGMNQIPGTWYYNQYNPIASWSTADGLYNYLVSTYVTTKATFYASSSSYYESIKNFLEEGSLVFFDYDGDDDWDHVMVIHDTYYTDDPLLTGHTADEINKRMDWAIYENDEMSASGKAKYVKVGY